VERETIRYTYVKRQTDHRSSPRTAMWPAAVAYDYCRQRTCLWRVRPSIHIYVYSSIFISLYRSLYKSPRGKHLPPLSPPSSLAGGRAWAYLLASRQQSVWGGGEREGERAESVLSTSRGVGQMGDERWVDTVQTECCFVFWVRRWVAAELVRSDRVCAWWVRFTKRAKRGQRVEICIHVYGYVCMHVYVCVFNAFAAGG